MSQVELEYSDRGSKRSKLYIAVGLLIAVVVGAVVFAALSFGGLTDRGTAPKMRDVVVAVRDIPGRKPIEDGDVAVRRVPEDPTNANALRSADEALGRISSVSISAGQLLTNNLLASSTAGQAFSILEPGQAYDPDGPDLRAVSISVPDERAVAGTLKPGQLVDLIVTLSINPQLGQPPGDAGAPSEPAGAEPTPPPFVPGPSTKATLQRLTILARTGPVYILRADLATAEKIAELTAAGGQFTLVLRPDIDDRVAETEGSTLDRLMEEFGWPIPKAPPLDDDEASSATR
jgi:Flp pilus assembly protein CpaB